MKYVFILTVKIIDSIIKDEVFSFKTREQLYEQALYNLTDKDISKQELFKLDTLNNKVTRIEMFMVKGKVFFKEEN